MKPQRTINFDKVQWADYWYVNQCGETKRCKPTEPTVHGIPVGNRMAPWHHQYPFETMLERATRLGILDKWTPRCRLVISANRELTYTGLQAAKMWQRYNNYIYKT